MDYKELLFKSINSDKYYTNTDLRMNRNYNFMLNNKELDEYLIFKEEYEMEDKIETSLLSWNTNKLYLYKSKELNSKINDYFEFFKNVDSELNMLLSIKPVSISIFIRMIMIIYITIKVSMRYYLELFVLNLKEHLKLKV